ncbi:MAG: phosphoribosylformylglycinamidine synthase subunit PurL, partial [Dehalococcoidia bacterium]
MPVPQEKLDLVALSRAEYDLIVQKIEREPNDVELGLFGSLWSEHCGYKHSKPLLGLFPTTGEAVRVEAGQENAGVVDIGDGWNVVFKIESHNHPSAVEPYQGAATGVGGIIRDILAMGARPVALLNSLRFGPLSETRNRYLFEGVVGGISGYGNCIGIPDVGGEIMFAPEYSGNPLVNAMCVGLLPDGGLMRAAASTPGNTLMLVGNATGRDGIHGASGLASRTFEEEREMRPTVQVGDPFLEKVLVEACLEAAKSGHLEGLQDLGAAGLTSSVMECADRGGTGVDIDVARVPRRETGMTPYEVMLSESQERMLLIVKKGHEREVSQIFERWDLNVVPIGEVTDTGRARILDDGVLVADVNVHTLVEAPRYTPGGSRPTYLDGLHSA